MIIVAGHVTVDPAVRETYLAECAKVVAAGRKAPGCLDVAINADLVDASRVNVYERWDSEDELMVFRQSGPEFSQTDAIKEMAVRRYEISSEGPA